MDRNYIYERYFDWLYELVCKDRFAETISFRKLLGFFHSTEFTYMIPNDSNRANDGVDLRYQFALYSDIPNAETLITGPCSVLEMMIALATNEERLMHNPKLGNRTAHWFWRMVVNLGLGGMSDVLFNRYEAKEAINKLLQRKYEPDGRGGLFTIKECSYDLRNVEIWTQACYYIDYVCGLDMK